MKHFGYSQLLCSITLAGIVSAPVLCQNPVVESPGNTPVSSNDPSTQTDINNSRTLNKMAERPGGQPNKTSSNVFPNKTSTTALLSSKEKKVLAASAEDQKANASFLHQHGTGIFRLLAASDITVNASNPRNSVVVPIRGGGAYYSFTKRTNDFDEWADIALRNGVLVTGVAVRSLGVMNTLGSAALESITIETPGVAYLAKFVPPSTIDEAGKQFKSLARGVPDGEFTYKLSMPVLADTTYVLRSIEYKRSDSLIAFRIVRQDADGNLTIIWKELKKFQVPTLNVPKKN